MKKHHTIIAISLAALFLTACGTQGMTDKGANYVVTDRDNQFFEKGITKLDVDYCTDIIQEQMRIDCENIVNSKTLMAKALEKNNEALCKNIKIVEYREICSKDVKEKIEKENAKKQEEEAADKKAEDLAKRQASIIQAGDISKCKALEDEAYIKACEFIIQENKKSVPEE